MEGKQTTRIQAKMMSEESKTDNADECQQKKGMTTEATYQTKGLEPSWAR